MVTLARSLVLSLVLLVGCGIGTSDGVDTAIDSTDEESRSPELLGASVDDARALPVAELSGLGKRTVGGTEQIVAVGDSSTTLVTFVVGADGQIGSVESHELSHLFASSNSQWEAVAGDSSGKVFVVEESRDRIDVIASDLGQIIRKLKLSMPADFPLAQEWAADANSRSEGILLLANGHIIVAKEKRPPALIEFAPRGETAAGFHPDLVLTGAFSLPAGGESELVAVKHWTLRAADEATVSDLSDITLDESGRLTLLSDQGQAIARGERDLDVSASTIAIRSIFTLPHHIKKPEGLVFAAGRPVVVIDNRHVEEDALFELSPLPSP